MERWAANTLRTLGIILVSGLVLVSSAVLALFSMCAYGGDFNGRKHPEQGIYYLIGIPVVIAVGIYVIAKLARGISRTAAVTGTINGVAGTSPEGATAELQLSPAGRKAVENLVLALGSQIVVSAAIWLANQRSLWKTPTGLPGHNWMLLLVVPFFLYHVPYAILIWALLKRPDQRAFTYSLAAPAMLILQSVFSLSAIAYYYVHQPAGVVLLIIPWLIDIVVLVLAYRAIQVVGLHPPPSSLIVAAVVMFVYFSFLHLLTPFIYRFAW